MNNNLLLYRNELKIKNIPKYKILGIITELIFSTEIFSRNLEIKEFLKDVLSTEYKDYVMKSRTLIVAKICRQITSVENCSDAQKKLYKFVCNKIDQLYSDEEVNKKKNTFDGWMD